MVYGFFTHVLTQAQALTVVFINKQQIRENERVSNAKDASCPAPEWPNIQTQSCWCRIVLPQKEPRTGGTPVEVVDQNPANLWQLGGHKSAEAASLLKLMSVSGVSSKIS